MKYVRLMGGLGNQMFQYAFAHALSRTNTDSVVLDKSLLIDIKSKENFTQRHFELNIFDIKISKIDQLPAVYRALCSSSIRHFLSLTKIDIPWIFYEKISGFDPLALEINKSIFQGYFQNEKYFLKYRESLIEDFTLIGQRSQGYEKYLNLINKSESVSIHFRRGDYLRNSNLIFHGVCSNEYYQSAVEYMAKRMSNPTFFIFSDEIDWVKNNFSIKYPTVYVDDSNSRRAGEDLILMSKCKNNIIANSSYSWWGGWLNQNINKTIIAPAQWFAKKSVLQQDIIPQSWIQI